MIQILRRLCRRSAADRDVREEIESHIAMREELHEESGMSTEEARRAARRQFGSITQIREQLHEFNGFAWLDQVFADLSDAVRALWRSPGVSLTVVVTVAIGVGAMSGMFTVMNNLILAPPPHVVEPDRLLGLYTVMPTLTGSQREAAEMTTGRGTSYRFYEQLAGNTEFLETVTAYARGVAIPAGAGPDAVLARPVFVSAGFWRTLGVRPALGRFIRDDEAHPVTGARVVVIGYGFWRSRFAGRADVVGRTLQVRGQPYEIVGVSPRGFRGLEPEDVDLWLPLRAWRDDPLLPEDWWYRSLSNVRMAIRLKEAVTEEEAAEQLTLRQRAFLEDAYVPAERPAGIADRQEGYRRSRVLLGPAAGGLSENLARVTVWLVGMAFVLVAIACANVGGLLLLRALNRHHEIAVRRALGVSRMRLARQLLTESCLLSVSGGVAAVLAVVWIGAWMQQTILPGLSWLPTTVFSPGTMAVAGLSILLTGVVTGIAPLWFAGTGLDALRGGSLNRLPRRPRTQSVLLVFQGALSIVLLIGAGLFLRSLSNVENLDLGFDRDNVLKAEVDFSGMGRGAAEVAAFFEEALARSKALPGARGASLSIGVPLRDSWGGGDVRLPGSVDPLRPATGRLWLNIVAPGFFETLGMRVLDGRSFVDNDRSGSPVIIVNETMARLGWPDRSPVGECVQVDLTGTSIFPYASGVLRETCTRVVGVVNDRRANIGDEAPNPFYYVPMTYEYTGPRTLLVRMTSGGGRIDNELRRALNDLDSALPYVNIATLGEALDPQIRPWRLGASMFTVFGMLALTLTTIGLWSSVAYAAYRRRYEFAIRRAVGAQRGVLMRLVLVDGLRNALAAVATGAMVAAAASSFVADLLFEVSPRDPLTYGIVAGGVLLVATAASVLPAWRSSGVHPAEALRTN